MLLDVAKMWEEKLDAREQAIAPLAQDPRDRPAARLRVRRSSRRCTASRSASSDLIELYVSRVEAAPDVDERVRLLRKVGAGQREGPRRQEPGVRRAAARLDAGLHERRDGARARAHGRADAALERAAHDRQPVAAGGRARRRRDQARDLPASARAGTRARATPSTRSRTCSRCWRSIR